MVKPAFQALLLAAFLGKAAFVLAQTPAPEKPKGESAPVVQEAAPPAAGSETKDALSAETKKKALQNPKSAEMTGQAPPEYKVKFETSKGDFVIQVHRDWAPAGADRFYNLVRAGYYDDVRFSRVISGFMAQFGIHGDPAVNAAWLNATIRDDPVTQSNTRGKVTFAMRGLNTRTTQIFINYANNSSLDAQRFAPFGEVIEGMEVVDSFYAGYGEGAPRGKGPDQSAALSRGNAYFKSSFGKLDYVKRAVLVD